MPAGYRVVFGTADRAIMGKTPREGQMVRESLPPIRTSIDPTDQPQVIDQGTYDRFIST